MEKQKKGLEIVNGLRGPRPNFGYGNLGQPFSSTQNDTVLCSYLKPFGKDDLTGALKAMEHRVSSLLEDRRRLGRDLHDCVLQSLYAIGLNLEASWNPNPHQSPESERTHEHLMAQLNHLIREVRAMIESLEAGTIHEFDITAELDSLRATYEQGDRLDVQLDIEPGAIDSLTIEEQREILNIVREALSNCARHADATRVMVAIRMRKSKVRVVIADDGRGFAPDDGCHRGYGLINMKARARKLGGTLHVTPTNHGTTVTVELSLSSALTLI